MHMQSYYSSQSVCARNFFEFAKTMIRIYMGVYNVTMYSLADILLGYVQ